MAPVNVSSMVDPFVIIGDQGSEILWLEFLKGKKCSPV